MSTNEKIDNAKGLFAKDIDALTNAAVTVSDMVSDSTKNIDHGNNEDSKNDVRSSSSGAKAKVGAIDAAVTPAANEAELTASFPQKVCYK